MDLQEFSQDMNNIKEIAEDFKSLKDIIQSMDIPEFTSKIKSALDGVSESMSNINKETSNENTEAKEAESSEVSEGEEETNEDGHQASVLSKIINKLKGLGSISLETFSTDVKKGLVKSISLSEQLNESINFAKLEFGNASQSIIEFGENSINSLGLSESATLKLTDSFGKTIEALGGTKSQSAELSMKLVDMAQNVSLATHGQISLAQSSKDLTSFINGNTNALSGLGVNITKTDLNQASLNSKFHEAYSKLTPYQKAIIDTKVAQEKLSSTFGKLGNNINSQYSDSTKLRSEFINLATQIGESLKPEMGELVKIVGEVNKWFSKLSPGIKDVIGAILGFIAVIMPIKTGIGTVVNVLSTGYKVMGKCKNIISGLIGKIGDFIETIGEVLGALDPITLVIGAIGIAVFALYEAWKHNFMNIRGVTKEVWTDIKSVLNECWNFIKDVCKDVVQIVKSFVKETITIFNNILNNISKITKDIEKVVITIWNNISKEIKKLVTDIKTIIIDIWDDIAKEVEKIVKEDEKIILDAWNDISKGVKVIVNTIKDIVIDSWNILSKTVSTIATGLKTILLDIWNAISRGIQDIINTIKDIVIDTWSIVSKTVNTIVTGLKTILLDIWNAISKGIEVVINTVKNIVISVWNDIYFAISKVVSDIKRVVLDIWNIIYSEISNITNGIKDIVLNIWHDILSGINNYITSIKDIISVVWHDISDIISNVVGFIKDRVIGIWENICNSIDRVVDDIKEFIINGFNAFKNGALSVMNDLESGISSVWNNITSWFGSAVEDLPRAILGILGDMESAGGRIVNSILDGLINGWHDITSWLGNALSGLVSGAEHAVEHLFGGSDGSHATGLNYVPWDGYRAELHKGEMVLTEEQAMMYRNNISYGGNTNITVNATSSNPYYIANAVQNTLTRMANGF